jgi:hypothetical protein
MKSFQMKGASDDAQRSVGDQDIALAPNGLKIERIARIDLDFAPQTIDLHINGAFSRFIVTEIET